MKRRFYHKICIVIIFMLISACKKDQKATKTNPILGDYPSIAKNYNCAIEEIENNIQSSHDIEKIFLLENDKSTLVKKKSTALEESFKKNLLERKAIPFDIQNGFGYYNIENVYLDKAYNTGVIQFEFLLRFNLKKHEYTPFIYFQAEDKYGNILAKAFAKGRRMNIEPGSKTILKGQLEGSELEHFAKITQISQNEYNKK